jgi:dolichyl-phosphate-mannose--protein O-mannosyl transferase
MEKFIPNPEGFEVKETAQGIAISYRWYKPIVWALVAFAAVWNGFLVVWFSSPTPTFFKLFALLHLAVGVGLVWYILCLFKNKTEIVITSQDFTTRHSPIPFPTYRNIHLKRSEIEQVYIRQDITRGKNSTTITYSVNVISPKGKTNKVLSYSHYEEAIFIKRKIEQYMHIEPKPIEGEYII